MSASTFFDLCCFAAVINRIPNTVLFLTIFFLFRNACFRGFITFVCNWVPRTTSFFTVFFLYCQHVFSDLFHRFRFTTVFVVITGAYGRLLNRRLLLAHAGIIRIIPLFALRIRRIVLANFFLSLGCRFRVGLFLCFGIRRVYFRLLVVFNRSDTFSRSGRNAENRSQRIARCGSDTAADGCALLSGIGRLGRNIRYCRTGLGNRVNLVQSLLSLIIGKVGNLVAVNRSFALFKFRLGPFLLFGRQVAGGKFLFEFVDTVLVFLVKGKFSSGFACILNIVGY